jgi:hypothetical protein
MFAASRSSCCVAWLLEDRRNGEGHCRAGASFRVRCARLPRTFRGAQRAVTQREPPCCLTGRRLALTSPPAASQTPTAAPASALSLLAPSQGAAAGRHGRTIASAGRSTATPQASSTEAAAGRRAPGSLGQRLRVSMLVDRYRLPHDLHAAGIRTIAPMISASRNGSSLPPAPRQLHISVDRAAMGARLSHRQAGLARFPLHHRSCKFPLDGHHTSRLPYLHAPLRLRRPRCRMPARRRPTFLSSPRGRPSSMTCRSAAWTPGPARCAQKSLLLRVPRQLSRLCQLPFQRSLSATRAWGASSRLR